MKPPGEKEGPGHGERLPSESVVIDIGGTIGALVVVSPPDLHGAEIEICPVGLGPAARTHTIVRAREAPGVGIVYAGVFPSLPEGDYTLLAQGAMPETVVRVVGGAVAQVAW